MARCSGTGIHKPSGRHDGWCRDCNPRCIEIGYISGRTLADSGWHQSPARHAVHVEIGRKGTRSHKSECLCTFCQHAGPVGHRSDCSCPVHSGNTVRPTSLERILREIILAEFPEVRTEEPFGPYRVDAYLPPPYHLAFEADGEFWHERVEKRAPGHYARRDSYLLENFGLTVVRLSETDLIAAERAKRWEFIDELLREGQDG